MSKNGIFYVIQVEDKLTSGLRNMSSAGQNEFKKLDQAQNKFFDDMRRNSEALKGPTRTQIMGNSIFGSAQKLGIGTVSSRMPKQVHPTFGELLDTNPIGGFTAAIGEADVAAGSLLGKFAGPMAIAAAGFFAVDKVTEFGQAIADATVQTQFLKAQLETSLTGTKSLTGEVMNAGEAAKAVYTELESFANKTPFQVQNLVQAFTSLQNSGIAPTIEQLTNFGDLASTKAHKTLNDLVEGIKDAAMGGYERMAEFDVKLQKNTKTGNILATYNNVTKEIKNSRQAITEYIASLGRLDNVKGAMERMSKTTGGMISNLEDSFFTLKSELGEVFKPLLDNGIDYLVKLTGSMREAAKWIREHTDKIKSAFAPVAGFIRPISYELDKIKEGLFGNTTAADMLNKSLNVIQATFEMLSPTISATGIAISQLMESIRTLVSQSDLEGWLSNVSAQLNVIVPVIGDAIKMVSSFSAMALDTGKNEERLKGYEAAFGKSVVDFFSGFSPDVMAERYKRGGQLFRNTLTIPESVIGWQAKTTQPGTSFLGAPWAQSPLIFDNSVGKPQPTKSLIDEIAAVQRNAPNSKPNTGDTQSSKSTKDHIGDVMGDARRARNVVINIQNFGCDWSVTNNNIKEAVINPAKKMAAELLNVVNDVNIIAG